jgi:hypothetical protein
VRETVPDALAALIGRLVEPAYLTGQRWDVLWWNAAAAALVGDFAGMAEEDRNILVFMLTDARARSLFRDGWTSEARRMVSLFRAGYDPWAGDPAFEALVARLRAGSIEFEGWWSDHDLAAPISGSKLLFHPCGDTIRYNYATFQANDDPKLKLSLYVRAVQEDRVS